MRFLSLLFVLLQYTLLAQVQLYVKPILNFKYQTSTRGVYSDLGQSNFMTNPYFEHYDRNFVFSRGFDFGIAMGVQFKKKHFFEVDYVNETVGKGSVLNYFALYSHTNPSNPIDETAMHISSKSYIGLSTHKLGFRYHYNFYTSKDDRFQMRFNFGVGTFFNFKNQSGSYKGMRIVLQSEEGEGQLISEGAYLVGSRSAGAFFKGWNGYVSTGLGFDINGKKRHILSIDLNYTQGFRSFYSYSDSYQIESSGVVREYSFLDGSRGSGLNIQISRRFQLYPWIKSKRKELQEQGVYKSKD